MADLVAAPFETTPVVAVRKPPTLALHQREATHAMCANIVAGHTRQLVVIATGGGKTVTFASFPRQLRRHIGRGTGRVLVLAHREELLKQAVKTFQWCEPAAKVGMHVGASRCHEGGFDVVVASVQSIARDAHLTQYAPDAFGIIVIDEAHHAIDESAYAKVARYFGAFDPGGPVLLGFTATPMRADGRSLSELFDVMPYAKTLEDGMREGWLTPCRYLRVEISADLLSVGAARDFNTNKLAALMDQPQITLTMLTRYRQVREEFFARTGRWPKTIAFAVSLAHAQHIVELCTELGIAASWVGGNLPSEERAARIAAFAAHEIEVLASVNLLLEGFDDPGVTVAIDLKPTRSLVLAVQEFGRALRLAPGKPEALYMQAVPIHAEEAGMIDVPQLFGIDITWNPAVASVVEHTPLHQLSDRLAAATAADDALALLRQDVAGGDRGNTTDGTGPADASDDLRREPLTTAERDAIIAAALAHAPEAAMHLVQALPAEFAGSDVLWQMRANKSAVVQVPDVGDVVILPPDLLGTTRIELHHGTTHTLLGVKRSLDDARRFAERHLAREYPSASPLIFRSQAMKWMERAATPAQRDELSRLLAGVDRQVVSRLKRGVASALLTYLKQRSAGRAA